MNRSSNWNHNISDRRRNAHSFCRLDSDWHCCQTTTSTNSGCRRQKAFFPKSFYTFSTFPNESIKTEKCNEINSSGNIIQSQRFSVKSEKLRSDCSDLVSEIGA